MKQEVFQMNFCFGEISPLHRQETELENHRVSLAELTNCVVLPSARLRSRPCIIEWQEVNDAYKQSKPLISKSTSLFKESIPQQKTPYDKSTKLVHMLFPGESPGLIKVGYNFIQITDSHARTMQFNNTEYPISNIDSVNIAQTNRYLYIASQGQKILYIDISDSSDLKVKAITSKFSGSDLVDAMPSKIIIHNKRLWCSSSVIYPNRWWVSRIGSYLKPEEHEYDMFYKGSKEKDQEREAPIYTTLPSDTESEIDQSSINDYFWFDYTTKYPTSVRWVTGHKYITFGDGFSEYSIRPINQHKTMTWSNLTVIPESNIGSAHQDSPIVLDNECFFIDTSRQKIFVLLIESKFEGGAKVSEASYLSNHLLKDGIKRMVYQKDPYGIIWILTMKNQLLSLTYNSAQKILGWAKHDCNTPTKIVDIVCFDQEREDTVAFLGQNDKVYILQSFSYLGKDAKEQIRALKKRGKKYERHVKVEIKTNNMLRTPKERAPLRIFQAQTHKIGMFLYDSYRFRGYLNNKTRVSNEDIDDDGYVGLVAGSFLQNELSIKFRGTAYKPMTILGLHAKFTVTEIN